MLAKFNIVQYNKYRQLRDLKRWARRVIVGARAMPYGCRCHMACGSDVTLHDTDGRLLLAMVEAEMRKLFKDVFSGDNVKSDRLSRQLITNCDRCIELLKEIEDIYG